ncbi:hypothetical protein Q8A67_025504 [Cirrhinus molitorella]|uniref:Uncharacterized protein n=1 Tax=Cirrhinus molitorella TaxID=172907 RepID=A0AA88T8B8_9TELE|nr:hypothetical protein Q8A67_025504 [Cirrhinus molitorella]
MQDKSLSLLKGLSLSFEEKQRSSCDSEALQYTVRNQACRLLLKRSSCVSRSLVLFLRPLPPLLCRVCR